MLWALLVSTFLFSAHADETLLVRMNAPMLLARLNKLGLCTSTAAARVCRSLPWIPSKVEGVIEVDVNLYLFIHDKSLENDPFRKWMDKFPAEKRYQYVSYVLAMRSRMAAAISKSGMAGLYVLILTGEGESLKPKSVFFSTLQNIIDQSSRHEQSIKQDLEKSIPEWLPPEDYDNSFQFTLMQN